jgi:uncharacterized protein YdbL (DUF1318 family)
LKKIVFILLILSFTGAGFAAFAQDQITVESAKEQGLIGERPDGLLGIVENKTSIPELVTWTNSQRMNTYRMMARNNNLPLEVVQTLAGRRLKNETPPGQYIFVNNTWIRK